MPTFKGLNFEFTDNNIKTVTHKAVSDVLMKAKPFDVITEEMMCKAVEDLEKTYI